MMITLSKRLQMVADLVPKCTVVADVGTDHGYLPVWLLQNEIAQRVLASDIHAGPLCRAQQTAAEHNCEARMELHLCDGLQFPDADRAQTVVIAGMGGETMISILSAAPWTQAGRTLVLQPQSKRLELEQWLYEHEYTVTRSVLCRDAGKLYLAISAVGKRTEDFRSVESLLIQSRDPLLKEYLDAELEKLSHAVIGLQKADRDVSDELDAVQHRMAQLEEIRREIASW